MTTRRTSATLLALVALCGSASAQGDSGSDEADYSRIVQARNREAMRFGEDPLVIVGVEQGDNSFRQRTPALLNSAGEAARVDEDELYRRTVAMYTTGATYSAPPIVRSSFRTRPDWDAAQRPAAPPPRHEGSALEAGPGIWSWMLPLAFFGVLVVLIRRYRAFQLSEIG